MFQGVLLRLSLPPYALDSVCLPNYSVIRTEGPFPRQLSLLLVNHQLYDESKDIVTEHVVGRIQSYEKLALTLGLHIDIYYDAEVTIDQFVTEEILGQLRYIAIDFDELHLLFTRPTTTDEQFRRPMCNVKTITVRCRPSADHPYGARTLLDLPWHKIRELEEGTKWNEATKFFKEMGDASFWESVELDEWSDEIVLNRLVRSLSARIDDGTLKVFLKSACSRTRLADGKFSNKIFAIYRRE